MKSVLAKISLGLQRVGGYIAAYAAVVAAVFAAIIFSRARGRAALDKAHERAQKAREEMRDTIEKTDPHDLIARASDADALRARVEQLKADAAARINDRLQSELHRK